MIDIKEALAQHASWLAKPTQGKKADLRYANLRYADLSDADLRHADLRYANLSNANLRYANLRYANLNNANLRYASLSNANLSNANLRYAVGNSRELKSLHCTEWTITYTKDALAIGCQQHAITRWWEFTDNEIAGMDAKALAWWKVWKPLLQQIIGMQS